MIPSLPKSIHVLRSATISGTRLQGLSFSFLESLSLPSTSSSSSSSSSLSSWVSIGLPWLLTNPFQSIYCNPPTIPGACHFLLDHCHHPFILAIAYMILSNMLYLARRAHLRRTTMRDIWRIRTTREPGISRALFGALLLAWQLLVTVYPWIEPIAWKFGYACFFYTYPNAKGGGYILEPLSCQRLASNLRTRQQVRCDWHRFKYNVGAIGRDGYRHPPTIQRNLPHFDVPQRQVKHWPWRRRHFQYLASSIKNTTTIDTDKEKEEG
jgi:hypothetical protein